MTECYSSEQWVSIALKAVAQTDGSARAVAHFIVDEVGGGDRRAGGLAAAFAGGVAELAQYALSRPDEALSSVEEEREAVEVSRRVVRPVFEGRLQQRLDLLDERLAGAASCTRCNATLESQGRRKRGWGSLLGTIALRRRYAWCDECERGEAPAQKLLGLPEEHFTARLEEAVTMMATTVPYEMAQMLAAKLCGVEVSKKALENMTERRAERLLAVQTVQAERCAPYDGSGLPKPDEQRPPDAVDVSEVADVAYLEMDGVLPMTRELLPPGEAGLERLHAAEQSKARGGKGRRYNVVGKEVKNAVLYRGSDCAEESPQRGCILNKTYVSYLGSWTAFAALLWVQLARLRFDQVKLLVILSDGAEWIRSIAQWLPFKTLLILDLFHVKHRIVEVAHALYGQTSAKAAAWAHAQYARIEAGQALMVIDALRFVEPPTADAAKMVDELKTYLRNNLDRMDYPAYRALGLRISSAAVESANFHVTGQRLKCQGMRWDEQGARQMAALRADLFNGRWETRTKQLLAA